MATPQLSPGVIVREVDLTVGRADNVLDNIGAIAGPFERGPVEDPVTISTEEELIQVFGKPSTTDGQYEYWMTASSFLSYGGILKVVRTDGDTIVNASSRQSRSGEITSLNSSGVTPDADRSNNGAGGTYVLAQLPPNQGATGYGFTTNSTNGTGAIVTVGISTTGGLSSVEITNNGYDYASGDFIYIHDNVFGGGGAANISFAVNGLGSGSGSVSADDSLKIKNYSDYTTTSSDIVPYVFAGKNPGTWTNGLKVAVIDDKADQILEVGATAAGLARVGYAVTVALDNVRRPIKRTGRNDATPGIGTYSGYLKGIITGVNVPEGKIDVKITSRVGVGTTAEEPIFYKNKARDSSFKPGNGIRIIDGSGSVVTSVNLLQGNLIKDWYNEQVIELSTGNVFWKSIAPKPVSNQHVLDRNGRNDAIHVVVFDDGGKVSGIKGNLLEKFVNLSKASDAVSALNAPQRIFWKDYIGLYSKYIFAGANPSDKSNNERVYATGFKQAAPLSPLSLEEGLWGEPGRNRTFSALGSTVYELSGGKDYTPVVTGGNTNPSVIAVQNSINVSAASTATSGSLKATLGGLLNAYDLFANADEIALDYLLMGPGLEDKLESQAKAENLIAIANNRKDCIACISPHRSDVVSDGLSYLSPDDQTENIVEFFSTLSSSSYAIFDSGYKYTYDRFNNTFRYIPCNGDVAGLCVRTSINAYPWFSPAGQQRGILNNAVKLAYNPAKDQRDLLYTARVNPIITQPGLGTLLYGDKTALGYASAFDRINVRRLFLTVEQALQRTADAQLFELNDEITRSNFINIVEPYLAEIKAKRGLYGYLVVCDETNNTPDLIDNNEFRADIYLKPAKSINYVTLTFVATRTGVSFEEVAGRA